MLDLVAALKTANSVKKFVEEKFKGAVLTSW